MNGLEDCGAGAGTTVSCQPKPCTSSKFARHILHPSDWFALFILFATLAAVVGLGLQSFSFAVLAVSAAISASALMIGRAMLSALPQAATDFRRPAEIVVGIAGLSIVTWLGCNLFGIPAGKALVGACGLGAAAFLCVTRGRPERQGWRRMDLVVLTAICGVSVVWCWQAIEAVPSLRTTGRFSVWGDYNLQAIQVAGFARLNAPPLAIPFYHSASLMLPAALNALAHVPALVCATALWTPLGFIMMGLGGYALGTAVAGRPGGIASAGALLLIPDPAHYLRNGMFDFHWLAEISTGASYAIGLSLVALGIGVIALRNQSARAFWLSLAISLGVLPLRSQIFLPLAITEVLLVIFIYRPSRLPLRVAGLTAIAFLMTGGVLIAEALPRAPHLFSDWPPDPIRYVRFALELGPVIQANAFDWFFARLPLQIPVAIGLIYLLLISGGGMLAAVLTGFIWCSGRQLLLHERWFPIAAVAAFVLIVVLIPPSNTLSTPLETQHSQFLFLYATLAAWSGCFVGAWAGIRSGRHAIPAVSTAAVLLLPVPFLLSATAQVPAGAPQAWAAPYVGLTIPPGMIEAAAFLRDHAALRDLVIATSNYQCGPLAALLERSTWFPERCEARSVTAASTTSTRLPPPGSVQAEMLSATNYDDFVAPVRKRRVDWIFVYTINQPPTWLAENAVWHDQTFFIIRVDRTSTND